MPVDYRYSTAGEVSGCDCIAFIPVGSLEQHCNLPLGLDGLIAERLAWRACERLEEGYGRRCLVMPTIYYGVSPEWMGSPGTVSVRVEVMAGLIHDILDSLSSGGIRRFVVVNGHGGNAGLLDAIAREAGRRLGVEVLVVHYWVLAGVEVGHASRVEAEIARGLGIEVPDPQCSGEARVLARGASAFKPYEAREAGLEGEGSVDVGMLVDEVARLVESFIESRGPLL